VFEWLQSTGGVPEEDMRRTFNLGVGMILIVAPEKADEVVAMLNDAAERAFKIGVLKAA
jgi:phosphoribosylformylglycinamidine cyclo-ligase